MKTPQRGSHSSFSSLLRNATATFLAVLVFAIPVASNAQETTSSIVGSVRDEVGNPVASAPITIRHEPTGRTTTTTSNSAGSFRAGGLRVGGPYTVTLSGATSATGAMFSDQRVESIFIALGEPFTMNFVATTQVVEGTRKRELLPWTPTLTVS